MHGVRGVEDREANLGPFVAGHPEVAAERDIEIFRPGPRRTVRPQSPTVNGGGMRNADASNHRLTVRSLPSRLGLPSQSGRTGAVESDEFGRSVGISGVPGLRDEHAAQHRRMV